MLKDSPELKYPKQAKKQHVEGDVSFIAVVQKDGTLGDIADLSGPEILVDATRAAIAKWKFDPATRNGEPIAAKFQYLFTYKDGNVGIRQTPIDPAHYTPPLRVRVSQGVLEGLVIKIVPPHYPADANGAEGTAVVGVLVGKDGRVQQVKPISGNAALVAAAKEAVEQWQYRPYTLNGVPVEVESTVTINFRHGH